MSGMQRNKPMVEVARGIRKPLKTLSFQGFRVMGPEGFEPPTKRL